jgi:hypothetical protein
MSDEIDYKRLAMANRALWAEIWATRQAGGEFATEEEEIIAEQMAAHPEYEPLWETIEELGDYQFDPEREENPFLHVSMHVTLDRQLRADDPPCVKATLDRLVERGEDAHEAQHAMLRVFVRQLWAVMTEGKQFDVEKYCKELSAL